MQDRAKITTLIERELRRNPSISTSALKTQAEKLDRTLKRVTVQQFHGRFALAVRKRLSAEQAKTLAQPVPTEPAPTEPIVEDTSVVDSIMEAEEVSSTTPRSLVHQPRVDVFLLKTLFREVADKAMRAESRGDMIELADMIDHHSTKLVETITR